MITVASLRPKTVFIFMNSKTRRLFHLVALLRVLFENDQSINDEHKRVLSANAPYIPSPPKGPDSSLEPNKKRSIPGNDLCPKVWDKSLMAVTCLFKKLIWYGKTFPYVQMRELRQNRRNERLQKIRIPKLEDSG